MLVVRCSLFLSCLFVSSAPPASLISLMIRVLRNKGVKTLLKIDGTIEQVFVIFIYIKTNKLTKRIQLCYLFLLV
ncbi:hypothetical protein H1P_2590008 [Hyella patelloides LEGE 07179]|uniref:Uncharacterized protein n=1 Tax=Hyella patelloides LEGE 07179 TaxID=945734 RepID=A0A563VSB0_9CYAN|nr:hypothetical protein H1P_2590008 [Hyella patelloides LEGE 07179]